MKVRRAKKLQSSHILNIAVLFRLEPEGGFTVLAPSLPGCITYGKDIEEAHKMAKEAIELYLESLADHGESLPPDAPSYASTISVAVPTYV